MKYVITGGAGQVSAPLTQKLLSAGHEVTVIGRNAENLKSLTEHGAKTAIGSVEDVAFLSETFKGADAVYTMVPPNFEAANWKEWIAQIGKNYAAAIKSSGVKYVVNLSSIGAHLPQGVGPVSGLHFVEKALNELYDVNVRHLRPGYFYTNFYGNIPMVKGMNLLGGNYGEADNKIILAHPNDIAVVAAEELLALNFNGHTVRYIASEEATLGLVSETLGAAVGKPQLPWVNFNDEQTLGALTQAGLPAEVASNYTEMGTAIRKGIMFEDYSVNRPAELGKIKLADFAKEFAVAYHAS